MMLLRENVNQFPKYYFGNCSLMCQSCSASFKLEYIHMGVGLKTSLDLPVVSVFFVLDTVNRLSFSSSNIVEPSRQYGMIEKT